jgi:hypothetical protein
MVESFGSMQIPNFPIRLYYALGFICEVYRWWPGGSDPKGSVAT